MLYLFWCLAKGLFFLFAGIHILEKYTPQQPEIMQPATVKAASTGTMGTERMAQWLGDGNLWLAATVLAALAAVAFAIRQISDIARRDFDVGAGNRFLEEMDEETYR